MITNTDLKIILFRWNEETYGAKMHFSQPDSDADTHPFSDNVEVRFDMQNLLAHQLDSESYGQLLSESLFKNQKMRSAFDQARGIAQATEIPLHVRLFIEANASELNALRWETLRDPDNDAPLITGERIIFSRYFASGDSRPVNQKEKSELNALVVVANPKNLSEYNLAPINDHEELSRAKSGLEGIRIRTLSGATLNNIVDGLRECNILYLVCHGTMKNGEPLIYLENDSGGVEMASGNELATRLKELQKIPRMVVLISCQSAGTGEQVQAGNKGSLAALGPCLAGAGIPAVLAMQGNLLIKTAEKFIPVFFRELQRDGQIDRAMAFARGTVRDQPDWWVPVLFMRSKSGLLWCLKQDEMICCELCGRKVKHKDTFQCDICGKPGICIEDCYNWEHSQCIECVSKKLKRGIDAVPETKKLVDLHNHNSSFKVRIWTECDDKPSGNREIEIVPKNEFSQYKIKDSVVVYFESSADAYIHFFNIGPAGNVIQMFPNGYCLENYVKKNTMNEYPDESARYKYILKGPPGTEIFKAFAMKSPFDISQFVDKESSKINKHDIEIISELIKSISCDQWAEASCNIVVSG